MAEPISIGGQTFIKTSDKGWIDKKTKQPAPEGLLNLLNSMYQEDSPEAKQKRVRVDTSRPPVKMGSSEFVWDLNGKTWVEKKTKQPVDARFSALIESVYQTIVSEESVSRESQEQIARAVSNGMGALGQTKVKTPSKKPRVAGSGVIPNKPVVNTKINSPIVSMIEKLASIDGFLKQRLNNQKIISDKNVLSIRENAIESRDATPETVENQPAEKPKSNATAIIAAVGLGTLIAAQFEPVREAFKGIIDTAKFIYTTFGKFVGVINDGLKYFLGDKSTIPSNAVLMQNGKLTASPGYKLSQPTTGGDTYVSREGSDTGYKVNQNAEAGTASIDYSQTAQIDKSTGVATPTPQAQPVSSSTASGVTPQAQSTKMGWWGAGTTPAPAQTSSPPQQASEPRTGWWGTTPTSSTQPSGASTGNANPVGSNGSYNFTPAAQAGGVVPIGKQLQAMGLRVDENIYFDGHHPAPDAHSRTGGHYDGTAIDVNAPGGVWEASDPKWGPIFDRIAAAAKAAGYHTLWRTNDHYDHIHIQYSGSMGRNSVIGGPGGYSETDAGGALGETMSGAMGGNVGQMLELGSEGMKTFGSIVKGLGRELVGDRTFVSMAQQTSNAADAIAKFSIEKTTAAIKAREEKPEPKVAALPNMNAGKPNAPIQTPATSSDRSSVTHYLARQGLLAA